MWAFCCGVVQSAPPTWRARPPDAERVRPAQSGTTDRLSRVFLLAAVAFRDQRHELRLSTGACRVSGPTSFGLFAHRHVFWSGPSRASGGSHCSRWDAHCSLAFGKLYLSKVPVTAVDVLHDRVWPFYEKHGVEIDHVLTTMGASTADGRCIISRAVFWRSAR
jgi:hypothetical protein